MTTLNDITINYISENAVLLEWPEQICPEQHQQIMACQQAVLQQLAEVVIEVVPSYASLLIYYHFTHISQTTLTDSLKTLVHHAIIATNTSLVSTLLAEKVIDIPVYYGHEVGWDLRTVAMNTGLSTHEVINHHSDKIYRAYALGFTPGFCYLGTLAPSLQLPRRRSPRLKVFQGAVAIAEQQTAVYPQASPGGWHILGQTPTAMFTIFNNDDEDEGAEEKFEATITVGQLVRFVAINKHDFSLMGGVFATKRS